MKKIIYIIICAICFAITSCENKWPKNGYLDGMWQILNIQHNGECVYAYDEKNPPEDTEIRYISFQLNLFQLSYRRNPYVYYGRFERYGDKLRLYQSSYNSLNESITDDNVLIPDSMVSKTIQPWGLYKNDNTYNIIKLNDNDLILQNDSATILFRKF